MNGYSAGSGPLGSGPTGPGSGFSVMPLKSTRCVIFYPHSLLYIVMLYIVIRLVEFDPTAFS